MKVTTLGFSDFDAQLLERQLRIVAGHSACHWEYAGEMRADADVLLVHSAQVLSVRVQGLAAGFDGVVAVVGADAGVLPHALHLEWPVRVFSLLALLDRAEAELRRQASLRPCCEQLAALQGDGWLEIDGWSLLIRAHEGVLLGMGGSFEQVVQAFMLDGRGLLAGLRHDAMPEDPVLWRTSLDSLVWSLALQEGAAATRHWPADRAWRISSYPHFEEWQVTPLFLRLAALFTRGHESVARAAAMTAVDAGQIRAFLYACQQCGLGLDSVVHEVQPQQAPRAAVAGIMGLLGQLRSRLGLRA